MRYHVVVLTRQDVNAGGLALPEALYEAVFRHNAETAQQIGAIRAAGRRVQRDNVVVRMLDPLSEGYQEARRRYGEDAFIVLFFNDAAEHACEMYGIKVEFAAEIRDDQLPANLGFMLQMDHFYVAEL
ncbi:MAG: hypothetical protein ABSE40_22750 [Candidatus Sulfotelmatobacter sp.]|jgi:hypothetical protein